MIVYIIGAIVFFIYAEGLDHKLKSWPARLLVLLTCAVFWPICAGFELSMLAKKLEKI